MVSDFKRIGLLIVTIIIAVVSSIFLSGLSYESRPNARALVKKLDGDTGVLIVYLRRKDRTIIFSDSTSEPYGEIKIYFTLDEVQYLLSD
jgi:hypothetical protein